MAFAMVGIGLLLTGLGAWQLKTKQLITGQPRMGYTETVTSPSSGLLLWWISGVEIAAGIAAVVMAAQLWLDRAQVAWSCNAREARGECIEYLRGHWDPKALAGTCSTPLESAVCPRDNLAGTCAFEIGGGQARAFAYSTYFKAEVADWERACAARSGTWKR